MTAPTLTEFLLARIAETEDAARYCLERAQGYEGRVSWDLVMFTYPMKFGKGPASSQFMRVGGPSPEAMLAECEAKRRIVEDCVARAEYMDTPVGAALTIRHLAAVYADHPDYDEAWRP